MFKLLLLLKCKRGFFSFLVSVFMISVVDLLSAGSSSAEERLCEELERLHGSPWGGGGRVREGFGGEGGLDRMRTGLAMSQLGGKCCQSWTAGWDEKLPPELSLTRAGAFPR